MIKKLSYAAAVLLAAAGLSSCSAPVQAASFPDSCAEYLVFLNSVSLTEPEELRAAISDLHDRIDTLHTLLSAPIQEMEDIRRSNADNDDFVDAIHVPVLEAADTCDQMP